ncbi:hypothetical protein B0H13DRAFT_1861561 [Mycena leptocephala]|nr:hypothetical protein B0H13DRAFT_1861561 [Mycena leptocephala]
MTGAGDSASRRSAHLKTLATALYGILTSSLALLDSLAIAHICLGFVTLLLSICTVKIYQGGKGAKESAGLMALTTCISLAGLVALVADPTCRRYIRNEGHHHFSQTSKRTLGAAGASIDGGGPFVGMLVFDILNV